LKPKRESISKKNKEVVDKSKMGNRKMCGGDNGGCQLF
jgi:hypothetical protein